MMKRLFPLVLFILPFFSRAGDLPDHGAHWDTINLFAYGKLLLTELPGSVDLVFAPERGFRAPAVGKILSRYGRRGSRNHNGIDIDVVHGQPIYSAFDGVVRLSKWNSGGFGHLVIVRHSNGLETYYAHLSRRFVAAGDVVLAGQTIGTGGRTGRASAVHLHFETRYCDQSFDPERIIDFTTGEIHGHTFALHKDYFAINSNVSDGGTAQMLDGEEFVAVAEEFMPPADSLVVLPEVPKEIYHRVKSGDTLLALALEYHTTVAEICRLNGIKRTSTLRIGRHLRML